MYTRTLALMAQEGVNIFSLPDESLSASYNNHAMLTFLESVATVKGVTGTNIGSWATKVHEKLRSIGLLSVRATVIKILSVNRKLRAAELPMMHSLTIEIMAREGVDSL